MTRPGNLVLAGAARPGATAPVRIGLLGLYGSANVGDTAIQTAVMTGLRSRRPDIEFVGLCPDPADTVRTFGITAFPLSGEIAPPGRNGRSMIGFRLNRLVGRLPLARHLAALRNINRRIRGLDMLLVSGGGQIDDLWGGPWQHPFRLWLWCALARRHGKPAAFFAIGVDRLNSRLSAGFAVRALRMTGYRTFRDSGSIALLRASGLDFEVAVCPDPAFGIFAQPSAEPTPAASPRFAVISPISVRAYQGASDAAYEAYLRVLTEVAVALRSLGLEVRFVCSQTRMDPPVAAEVMARINADPGVSLAAVRTFDDFILAVRGAQFVIASRLHAQILALVAGTPLIAIAPVPKVRQLMIDVGLEEYCVDLPTLQVDELLSCVHKALARRDELRALIRGRVRELRESLEQAFDQLSAVAPTAN